MIPIGIVVRPDEFRAARAAGYDYAEVSARQIAAMSDEEFVSLEREVERAGMPIRAMNAYCPPEIRIAGEGFDPNAARAYARRLARRAGALGVRVTGVGSPNSRDLPEGYPRPLADRQAIEFLRASAEEMDRYGVSVLIEALAPVFCNYINTIDEAARLARRAGVGIVADFYNMERMGEGDMNIAPYIDLIAHAHISDDDGAPLKRAYLDPKKAADHAARVRGLLRVGYKGALTVEIDIPFDEARAEATLNVLRAATSTYIS